MGILRDYTVDLLEEQREILEKEHPITARAVFYRLVSNKSIKNKENEYQGTVRRTSLARWAYLRRTRRGKQLYGWEIPFEWIIDESRELEMSRGFNGLKAYLDYVAEAYGRNEWIDQAELVMVGVEKAAMAAILQPIIDKWNVPFLPFIGQVSDTLCYQIGMMLHRDRMRKPIKILYLGDHDGSGLGIPEAAGKKIREVSQRKDIEWIRVAITKEQFLRMRGQFGIPVNPDDPYRNEYPYSQRVELDAMPSKEVRELLDEEIQKHVDMDAWEASQEKEEQEQEHLKRLVPKWKTDLEQ